MNVPNSSQIHKYKYKYANCVCNDYECADRLSKHKRRNLSTGKLEDWLHPRNREVGITGVFRIKVVTVIEELVHYNFYYRYYYFVIASENWMTDSILKIRVIAEEGRGDIVEIKPEYGLVAQFGCVDHMMMIQLMIRRWWSEDDDQLIRLGSKVLLILHRRRHQCGFCSTCADAMHSR